MLKSTSGLAFASALLALTCSPSLAMAHGRDYLFNSGSHYVQLEANRVVIKGNASKRAVIGKTGTLKIGGRPVAVSAADQTLLTDYYGTVFDIQEQAKGVAKQAVSDSLRTVGDVLEAVFSGVDSANTEAAEEKKLRLSVHAAVAPLCQKVGQLKALQDKIAMDVPAFMPYAVVVHSDVKNCER